MSTMIYYTYHLNVAAPPANQLGPAGSLAAHLRDEGYPSRDEGLEVISSALPADMAALPCARGAALHLGGGYMLPLAAIEMQA